MRNTGKQDNFHRPSHHNVSTFLCTPPPGGGIYGLSHLRSEVQIPTPTPPQSPAWHSGRSLNYISHKAVRGRWPSAGSPKGYLQHWKRGEQSLPVESCVAVAVSLVILGLVAPVASADPDTFQGVLPLGVPRGLVAQPGAGLEGAGAARRPIAACGP